MHREDNSRYLLYIEPPAEEKLAEPINDDLVELMQIALERAQRGTSMYSRIENEGNFYIGGGFRGTHATACGERSDNCDFLLENGMITNSLAVFYLQWYRNSIPETEMKKLKELENFYSNISEFKKLGEFEGEGTKCCGKNMVIAESGIVYNCLKCGNWEYSSS